ncbi:hypothetical protein O9992_24485 [Vibrio lentus]|nr:hypothetical protein [Vibrio lentus]
MGRTTPLLHVASSKKQKSSTCVFRGAVSSRRHCWLSRNQEPSKTYIAAGEQLGKWATALGLNRDVRRDST